MTIFKCKMCGGTLEVNNKETVGVCEYCGTKQTLPKLDNERKMNLYDRANHFRRNDEFDKAMSIYEQILNEDRTDAESYWSIVLCRYGIEYVEEPTTHKRIPTINRTQLTSIFDDEDYKSALQYADGYQREIYENEANAINEIQKGILAISQKEEPFDVFICYKETDNQGRRTQDSVLAQELYYELVEEGFKVFFAKITFEDKLGQEYEPYIFAALNSAKVMVVLGTKPEHFNAVWVKNEWSRYLALIKKGQNKMLIPAYRDMDPYDLPEEFSHLQAQDMAKLGLMQDLVRGIKKIVQVDTTNTDAKAPVVISGNANTSALLRRAYLFLEDGDWENADEYCEKVLDLEPENASAYLGKLMVELKVKRQEALKDCAQPFDDKNNYQKVLRFADATLASSLKEDNDYIKERNENARLEGIYTSAVDKMQSAMKERHYKEAAEEFRSIGEYKDSVELFRRCLEQAEVARKDDIYSYAKTRMVGDILGNYEEAIHQFEFIPDWKDSQEQIIECQRKIEEIKEEQEKQRKDDIYNDALIKYNVNSVSDIEEAIALLESILDWRDSRTKIAEYQHKIKEVQEENKRKKRKRTLIEILSILVAAAIICFIIVLVKVIIPNNKYEKAISLSERERYDEAITIFKELDDYKESKEYVKKTKYNKAMNAIEEEKFDLAHVILYELGDYEDCSQQLENIKPYVRIGLMKYGIEVGDTVLFGKYEQDNDTTNGQEEIEWIVVKRDGNKVLLWSKYYLDYQPYSTDNTEYWENSYLRQWLNSDFINTAFNKEQQEYIQESTINNAYEFSEAVYESYGGPNTVDRVFIFSADEIPKYKKYVEDFRTTVFAKKTHIYEGEGWLRSPSSKGVVASIRHSGEQDGKGGYGIWPDYVMPALWINVENIFQ